MAPATCWRSTPPSPVARSFRPAALAISPGGTKLYAVSAGGGFNQGRVLSYDISGITCAAGTCTCATPAATETTVVRNLQFPNGLAFDTATAPNLYVSDTFLRAVAQISRARLPSSERSLRPYLRAPLPPPRGSLCLR